MKQVFYIHGGSAFSDRSRYLQHLKTRSVRFPHGDQPDLWPKLLRTQLGNEYEVFTPAMPNSQNAQYEEWKIWFERHFEYLNDNLILVGWSQGALFLLKYLSEEDTPFAISHVCLLASPGFQFVDESGEDGGDFMVNTEQIKQLSAKPYHISLFHSIDDFVVPYEHAVALKAALPEAELVTFSDKNHFLIPEFPELVAYIKSLG